MTSSIDSNSQRPNKPNKHQHVLKIPAAFKMIQEDTSKRASLSSVSTSNSANCSQTNTQPSPSTPYTAVTSQTIEPLSPTEDFSSSMASLYPFLSKSSTDLPSSSRQYSSGGALQTSSLRNSVTCTPSSSGYSPKTRLSSGNMSLQQGQQNIPPITSLRSNSVPTIVTSSIHKAQSSPNLNSGKFVPPPSSSTPPPALPTFLDQSAYSPTGNKALAHPKLNPDNRYSNASSSTSNTFSTSSNRSSTSSNTFNFSGVSTANTTRLHVNSSGAPQPSPIHSSNLASHETLKDVPTKLHHRNKAKTFPTATSNGNSENDTSSFVYNPSTGQPWSSKDLADDIISSYTEGFDFKSNKKVSDNATNNANVTKSQSRCSSIISSDDEPEESNIMPDQTEVTTPTSPMQSQAPNKSSELAKSSNNNLNSPKPKVTTQSVPPIPSLTQSPLAKTTSDPSRDRYGFKKQSAHITEQQYDEWWKGYSEHLKRRKQKWIRLMKENGLSIEHDQPQRFPPKSEKLKRYIRKGIPAEWRGNAWFFYAKGSEKLNGNKDVYSKLCAQTADLKNSDTEIIERDLYRTFPDNIHFRADVPHDQQRTRENEPVLISTLRRLLVAFSVYQPKIGYCQSLNFLAGLLLLFMDEEKAFWMLVIITQRYLPGVHEVNLEGVNVDQGVLMLCTREALPKIWNKIGTNFEGRHDTNMLTKLPPITLCTAAWFMSGYIGILPIETTLRVWDCFFFEDSKTFFRIALTIFKLAEPLIEPLKDPMEVFQVIQTFPKKLIDPSVLMSTCFKRRNGIGHISQEEIVKMREFVRIRRQQASIAALKQQQDILTESDNYVEGLSATRHSNDQLNNPNLADNDSPRPPLGLPFANLAHSNRNSSPLSPKDGKGKKKSTNPDSPIDDLEDYFHFKHPRGLHVNLTKRMKSLKFSSKPSSSKFSNNGPVISNQFSTSTSRK